MEMNRDTALVALDALANGTRLDVFRLLVEAGHEGMLAGEIAAFFEAPQSTMSTHLATLARSGLLTATREGRGIRYRAELAAMGGLLAFLMQDCCRGRPELCQPALDAISCEDR